jgi:Domain of unknown function (DUF4276)
VSDMHAEFRIFVEGGAKGQLAQKCRQGFARFFEKAGLGQRKPRIVSCGSRKDAYDDFCHALSKTGVNDVFLLLVDSEAPVMVSTDQVWTHVKERQGDGWDKPATADAEMLHFMVECMENWFLADPRAMESFFGQGFNVDALPKKRDIESIAKAEVYEALKKATSKLKTKRSYGKGEHSFPLLEKINPVQVEASGDFGRRVIEKVRAVSNLPFR